MPYDAMQSEPCGLRCLWFCRVSRGAAWFPEKGWVRAGVKNRIQSLSPWLMARREGRDHLLPPPSLRLLGTGRLSGHQLSGTQLCGWHRYAVGRWGGSWVFTGRKPDGSCGIQGSQGEDVVTVQGLWGGGRGMQGQDWVTAFPHPCSGSLPGGTAL